MRTISLLLTFTIGFSLSFTYKHQLKIGDSRIFYINTNMRGNITVKKDIRDPLDVSPIQELVTFLKNNNDWVFEIIIHTDTRGSKEANDKYSQFRAENFKSLLIQKYDVPEDHIIANGKGEKEPLVSESIINQIVNKEKKENAHSLNRRIELKVIQKYRQ